MARELAGQLVTPVRIAIATPTPVILSNPSPANPSVPAYPRISPRIIIIMAQKPPLSLTAELEKLEQSITLTLQGTWSSLPKIFGLLTTYITRTEIDHNFSKTHRIVTTSIIPIVERYAKESEAVWEGSKVL